MEVSKKMLLHKKSFKKKSCIWEITPTLDVCGKPAYLPGLEKIAVTFEPIVQFQNASGFRMS